MARGEEYVRPPLVPSEAVSVARATWRFRVVALVLLAVLIYVITLLFLHFSGIGTEDPGLGGGLRAPRGLVAAGP